MGDGQNFLRELGHRLARRLLLAAAALPLTACAVTSGFGDFAEFRTYEGEDGFIRLPVVFIPGIKGSRLSVVDEAGRETELWGTTGNVAVREGFDRLFLNLSSKMGGVGTAGESFPLPEEYARLGVRTELLESYWLGLEGLPKFLKFDVYGALVNFLKDAAEGGYTKDEDLFVFSYDWRLDNRLAAVRLALELVGYRKEYMKHLAKRVCRKGPQRCGVESPEDPVFRAEWERLKNHPRNRALFNARGEIKFIVVGHSMGGLVARYLVWGMRRHDEVGRVLLLATPNFGSIDTLVAFRDGEYPEALTTWIAKRLGSLWTQVGTWLGFGVYEQEDTKPILFSFASAFQLLPRHRERSVREPALLMKLGLDPSEAPSVPG